MVCDDPEDNVQLLEILKHQQPPFPQQQPPVTFLLPQRPPGITSDAQQSHVVYPRGPVTRGASCPRPDKAVMKVVDEDAIFEGIKIVEAIVGISQRRGFEEGLVTA